MHMPLYLHCSSLNETLLKYVRKLPVYDLYSPYNCHFSFNTITNQIILKMYNEEFPSTHPSHYPREIKNAKERKKACDFSQE